MTVKIKKFKLVFLYKSASICVMRGWEASLVREFSLGCHQQL